MPAQTSGAVVAQDSGRSHNPAHSIMFYTVTLQGWEFPRVLWTFFLVGGVDMEAGWCSAFSAAVEDGAAGSRSCPGVQPQPL